LVLLVDSFCFQPPILFDGRQENHLQFQLLAGQLLVSLFYNFAGNNRLHSLLHNVCHVTWRGLMSFEEAMLQLHGRIGNPFEGWIGLSRGCFSRRAFDTESSFRWSGDLQRIFEQVARHCRCLESAGGEPTGRVPTRHPSVRRKVI